MKALKEEGREVETGCCALGGISYGLRRFPDGSVGRESTCNAGDLVGFWVRRIHWRKDRLPTPVFLGFTCGSAGKEFTCYAGDLDLICGLGRSHGEGNGYPPQYSGLENSMDSIVRGVAKSWTRLSDFHLKLYLGCAL